ncbi:MAG: Fis family transcriptional regulator [Chlorobiaceae bacterium]|nr:Fis family transcriptional regulator [Chlorobiaceae bacterium]MBA4309618.1 Fis family transcriptional regulator [Chlorobiaceae bacterium]
MNRVLIIDDEKDICESIKMILEYEGYEVEFATSGTSGLAKLDQLIDLVLLDIQMPDINGFEVLTKAKEQFPHLNIIMISAFSSLQNAINATKLGAFDFLEKPIDRDKLVISVRNAIAQTNLFKENEEIRKTVLSQGEIIGSSKAIKNILDLIERISPNDTRVLITGENGTGKELVARAIHKKSLRKDKSLVEVNCAAIPNELIESELFGHEKGSFTGAINQRIGRFELADKGTLFLDEIGDMSLNAQAKVLRAIEDGIIQRVGGTKKIAVDVRIIAATNKNLLDEIEKNNFRYDLYHRLNVIPIHVPPLRERLDDIPLLVNYFIKDICEKYKKPPPFFSDSTIKLLQGLSWTGNVRELRNIVERIIIIANKKEILARDIEFLVPREKLSMSELISDSNSFQEFKDKSEKAFILKQLETNSWNISKTAEILDIQRSHLYNKMKKYGIEKGE